MAMEMKPVKSSNINRMGYDADTKTMRVEFASGQTYDYPNTKPEEHAACCGAGSVGSHFHKHFVAAKRACSKLT